MTHDQAQTRRDDDKPVKLTVTLSAALHRNLVAYAEVLAKEVGKPVEAQSWPRKFGQ